jgi:hypothetical protein
MRAWFESEGIELPVPNHTHISRRVNALADKIPLPPKHTEGGIWVTIDNTEIKVADKGK